MVEIIGAPGYAFDPETDSVYHGLRQMQTDNSNCVQLTYGENGNRQKKRISLWKIKYATSHKLNVWKLKDVKICMTADGELVSRSNLIKRAVKMRDMGRAGRTRSTQIDHLKERIGEMQRLLEALECGNFGFVYMDMKRHTGAIANELKKRFGITDKAFIDEIVEEVIHAMLDYIIDNHGYLCGYSEMMKKKAIRAASDSLSRRRKTVTKGKQWKEANSL